ncbi:MAG: hypothetical protein QXQ68_05905 [Candidatus Nitrosocaldaceae archaeon]
MNTNAKEVAEGIKLLRLIYSEEEIKLLLSIWKREGVKVEEMIRLHLQHLANNLITGEVIGEYE